MASSHTVLATVAIVAALALSVGQAHAERVQGTSIVRVHVILPASSALAGTTVRLEDADAASRTRTIALPSTGLATFAAVPSGTIIVSVVVPGAAPAQARVTLGAHEIVTLRATIDAAASSGVSGLVVTDRDRLSESVVFDPRFLRDLPATSHVSTLIETAAPFVVVDQMDTGGLTTAQTTFMGSRGASFTSTSMAIGSRAQADIGRVGLAAAAPDLGSFDSVVVTHGMAPVDVSTPGVHVSFVPRLPGPTRRGTARASFTTAGMVATNALPDAPSIARLDAWRDAAAELSGPLRSDIGGLMAVSTSHVRQQHRDDPRMLTARTTSVLGRMSVRTNEADQLLITGGAARISRPFDGRGQLARDDVDEGVSEWHAAGEWVRVTRAGLSIALAGGLQRHTFTPALENDVGGVVDRVFDGVVPEPPARHRSLQSHAGVEVRAGAVSLGRTRHSLRVGATVRRETIDAAILALPVVAETVAGLPARVWRPVASSGEAARSATETAMFVEDRLDLTPSVTGVAGLRFAAASGSAAGADAGIEWRTMSPRIAMRWRLGPLAVFGGIGRYAADLPLFLLAYGDPGAPWSEVYRWTDADGSGRFEAGEAGVLLARAGPGAPVASIDADLEPPRTTEWTVGGEVAIGRHHRLRGSIAIRRQRSLVGLINAGVPLASYDTLLVPDQNTDWDSPTDDHLIQIFNRRPDSFGLDAFVLTNPDDAAAEHDGIEIAWTFQSARWQMLFGATAYRSIGRGARAGFRVLENDHGLVGEQYANPNASIADPGRLFFDRGYVGKWSASYHARGDIRLAAVARYQDGQPFSRVIIADLSTGPEMIQVYSVGRTRFTYTATVDARLEKGFTLAARRAAIQLDVFNLTNHRNEVEEDVLTRETFRRSTAVQPPLTLRLGFRIDF
jgi:hypothetical protein